MSSCSETAWKTCFQESMEIFFKVIENNSKKIEEDRNLKKEFITFKDHYLKARSAIVSLMIVNAIRNNPLEPHQKKDMINQINKMDNDLHDYIRNSFLN